MVPRNSKKDQILLVKIAKYIGFYGYRRSYQVFNMVPRDSIVVQRMYHSCGRNYKDLNARVFGGSQSRINDHYIFGQICVVLQMLPAVGAAR